MKGRGVTKQCDDHVKYITQTSSGFSEIFEKVTTSSSSYASSKHPLRLLQLYIPIASFYYPEMSDDTHASAPFEGPEKLLEIWFAPTAHDLPDAPSSALDQGRFGLRKVKREVWEEMLGIVKCKVLSMVEGTEMDAYLLR